MYFDLNITEKHELELALLLMNLGVTYALERGLISIEDSERVLYRPNIAEKLENLSISKDILRLIEMGCELEDVESLIPEKLQEAIQEISLNTQNLLLKEKD